MEGTYSWPELSAKDIVLCLGPILKMVEADLQKPTPERLRQLYSSLVDMLTGITKEELEQPDVHVSGEMDYPEMHNESIPELAFYRALHSLMRAVGVADFSIKYDLLNPKPRRTAQCLSAVINFLKYREVSLEKYVTLRAQLDEFLERREQLLDETQRLHARKQELLARRKKEEPIVEQLRLETAELKAQVDAMNVQQAASIEESRETKAAIKLTKENIAAQMQATSLGKQDLFKLKFRVVSSPDGVKRHIDDMSASVEDHRQEIADTEKRCRVLQSRIDQLAKLENEVKRNADLLEKVIMDLWSSDENKKEAKHIAAQLEECKQKREELTTKKSQLERQLESTALKLANAKEAHSRKVHFLKQKLQQAEQQRIECDEEVANNSSLINENTILANQLEDALNQERGAHDTELLSLRTTYEELHAQVGLYHQRLFEAMQA